MSNKMKPAFDGIRAKDSLKANTLLYLQKEIQKENKSRSRTLVKSLTIALASFVIILFSGVFSYSLYFTPSVYVDLDVNPSIELSINRFDRVISVYPYNIDGEDILSGLDLKHKNHKDAIKILIDTISQKGYMQDEGLVSVTLQTSDTSKESELLSNIKTDVEVSVFEHHAVMQIDVFTVSNDIRSHAHDLNISPAKYLAILELQEADPTVTVESCEDHTIGEIRRLTQDHTNGHHGGNQGHDTGSQNNQRNNDTTHHGKSDSHDNRGGKHD